MFGSVKGILFGAVVVAMITGGSLKAVGQTAADYQRILKDNSPAIVTIKFVMKIKVAGKSKESESETTGVMIDPKGLILCSNTEMGGLGADAKHGSRCQHRADQSEGVDRRGY